MHMCVRERAGALECNGVFVYVFLPLCFLLFPGVCGVISVSRGQGVCVCCGILL